MFPLIPQVMLSLPVPCFPHTDPDVWFIESFHGMVTKTSEEGIIPCVVTNPQINVTLYERDSDMHLKGSTSQVRATGRHWRTGPMCAEES